MQLSRLTSEHDSDAKPQYSLPSMGEIRARPSCGLQVVSTFSGCGGSCLGFEQEGYRIRFASEFVTPAADTYHANHPDVPVDTGDIRELHAQHVLDVIGMERGQLDVLEGSPPCASFSASGIQARQWGQVKSYSGTQQRTDGTCSLISLDCVTDSCPRCSSPRT